MPRGGNGNGNSGNSGGNTIRGNNKDNSLFGTVADEFMYGRGDDFIFADAGNDVVDGGSGNDTINGGSGDDTVTGGEGADVFVVDANTERLVITDFEDGVDQIDLTALNIDVNNPASNQYWGDLGTLNGDTILTFYDTNTYQTVAEVVLENFDFNNIDITDYIL